MSQADHKNKLQNCLLVSKYPRRNKAQFTMENDHNPLILQDCAECHGTGKRDRRYDGPGSERVWALGSCDTCAGTGITGAVEPYFTSPESGRPPVMAHADSEGRLRCPACEIIFHVTDPHRWTGYRHVRCGQRIRVVTEAA